MRLVSRRVSEEGTNAIHFAVKLNIILNVILVLLISVIFAVLLITEVEDVVVVAVIPISSASSSSFSTTSPAISSSSSSSSATIIDMPELELGPAAIDAGSEEQEVGTGKTSHTHLALPLSTCARMDKRYGSCSLADFVKSNAESAQHSWGDARWNATCGN